MGINDTDTINAGKSAVVMLPMKFTGLAAMIAAVVAGWQLNMWLGLFLAMAVMTPFTLIAILIRDDFEDIKGMFDVWSIRKMEIKRGIRKP